MCRRNLAEGRGDEGEGEEEGEARGWDHGRKEVVSNLSTNSAAAVFLSLTYSHSY